MHFVQGLAILDQQTYVHESRGIQTVRLHGGDEVSMGPHAKSRELDAACVLLGGLFPMP